MNGGEKRLKVKREEALFVSVPLFLSSLPHFLNSPFSLSEKAVR